MAYGKVDLCGVDTTRLPVITNERIKEVFGEDERIVATLDMRLMPSHWAVTVTLPVSSARASFPCVPTSRPAIPGE